MIPEPTSRERAAAAAMHLGTIYAPIVAPVLALTVGCRSAYVCAHARRSLKETILLQAALLVLGICSIAYSLWSLYGHYQNDWQTFSLWPLLAKAAVLWLLLLIVQFVNAVQAVRQAVAAYRGNYPALVREKA